MRIKQCLIRGHWLGSRLKGDIELKSREGTIGAKAETMGGREAGERERETY